MKIANDLRWMNSGPLAGLGEISLPALQPGSSIMPGKVNPVIPGSRRRWSRAQVIGNDATITIAGQSGNFQLNVMLPVIAYNLLQSIELLANASRALADAAIAGFTVNEARIATASSAIRSWSRRSTRYRLRKRRKDRQAGLCRGPADPRSRRGAHATVAEDSRGCSIRAS